MILNIRFPFMIVKTDYLKEQTQKTEARLEDTIKSLNEKIKSMEKMKREIEGTCDKVKRDIQFWRDIFGRFSKQECLHCKKEIVISPIGDGYYIEKDGVVHRHCLDEYLGRR